MGYNETPVYESMPTGPSITYFRYIGVVNMDYVLDSFQQGASSVERIVV